MHAVREHDLPIGALTTRDRALESCRRHLLHEVRARERARRRRAVVVEEREALARETAPVPAQIAEVQVGEVDEIGSAEHQRRKQREEEGELLDEVGVTPDAPADERGEPARARKVPEHARLDAVDRRAGEHRERNARVVPQRARALEREGLEAPELPAKTGAREVDAHRVAGGEGRSVWERRHGVTIVHLLTRGAPPSSPFSPPAQTPVFPSVKLGFVTINESTDVQQWSGLNYHIARSLEHAGATLVRVGPLTHPWTRGMKLRRRWYGLTGHQYHANFESIALDAFGAQARQMIPGDVDAVVAVTTLVAASLDGLRVPVISWDDATPAAMTGYYPDFQRLSTRSARDARALGHRATENVALALYASEWAACSARTMYGLPAE